MTPRSDATNSSWIEDCEREFADNPELCEQTIRGLMDFAEGKWVSSDWLFEGDGE